MTNRWPVKPLGDFFAEKLGSVDPSKFPHEMFDLYSIPAFDAGMPDVCAGADIGSSKQVVRPRDLLLSRIVPHIRRAWVVGDDHGRRLIASGEWIVFRHAGIDPRYLRYFLLGDPFHAQFMQTVSGVGGSLMRAKVSEVARICIPLPPLSEQERIVKLLDEADALRKLRAQTDRRTANLIPALFHEMFGDMAANSKHWKLAAISDIADVQGGLQLTPLRETYPLRRPYLRVANVQRGYLLLDEIRQIGLLDSEFARTKLEKGDLLLVEGNGNPKEVGRAAMWDGSVVDCVHQNHLIRVRPRIELLTPFYLLAFLNSDSGRRYFHSAGNSTSGLSTITTSIVKSCRIPLPPKSLQESFAARMNELSEMEARQAASRLRLDALFQSLLHRAFAGQL